MYKLLIADDESEVIEGIKSSIDWEDHGIEICGEAETGAEALGLIQELFPDILLIDVRMPEMSGISLLERIKDEYRDLRFVILSGHDEFEYAQRALSLGATDYLLKPCKPEDILKAVLKAKSELEAARSQNFLLRRYEDQLKQNLPAIRENFLAGLLQGKAGGLEYIAEKILACDIALPLKNLNVALLSIDNLSSHATLRDPNHLAAMKLEIQKVMREGFRSAGIASEILPYEEYMAVIYGIDQANGHSADPYAGVLSEVRKTISRRLDFTVTVGIGNPVFSIVDLSQSLNEARLAAEMKFFLGEDREIFSHEIVMERAISDYYPFREETEIIKCIQTRNKNDIKARVDDFCGALLGKETLDKEYLKRAIIALLGNIYKYCLEQKIDTSSAFGKKFGFFDAVQQSETILQLKDHIQQVLFAIIEQMNNRENINKLVEASIQYIKANYSNDIGLETVARIVHITPGYLSLLFKQKTGENFVGFLQRYRVERARELLNDLGLKCYEVAGLVGYQEEKYFSRIFKKYTGMTPKQYRNSL
jgi:two-component system, response regulator YesN